MEKITRRNFLQIAGAAAFLGAAGTLTGCSDGTLPSPDGSTPLTSVKMIKANEIWKWQNTDPIDSFGNIYYKAVNYVVLDVRKSGIYGEQSERSGYRNFTSEYYTAQKYNKLTMTIAPDQEMCNEGSAYVKVYADDKLVKVSNEIGRKTKPFTMSVDITGADFVKLVVQLYVGNKVVTGTLDSDEGAIIIADAKLWKN